MFTVQPLGNIPGGVAAAVYGVNEADEAVGASGEGTSACPYECAVVWHDGTPTVLKTQANMASAATAINNAGQVAGYMFPNRGGLFTAVVWSNGTPTLLPGPPQYEDSLANAINDAGQVVGQVFGSDSGFYEAAVWNGLTPMVLGVVPGCTAGVALGINGNGLIVGALGCGKDSVAEPAVWHGTTATLLPIPIKPTIGGPGGKAFAGNDLGLVVGSSNNAGGNNTPTAFNATAWDNGVVTDLGPFPAKEGSSSATAVNKQGIIVGKSTWVLQELITHAALWSPIGSAPQDLNDLIGTAAAEVTLTEATGINNHCTIVANGYSETGGYEAFLLKLIDPSRCVKGLVAQKPES
jgi:uncharacterized membrane protein